jgi:hypothetical protein
MPIQASQHFDHEYHEEKLLRLIARRPDLSADPIQIPALDRQIQAEWDLLKSYRLRKAIARVQVKCFSSIGRRILCVGSDELVLKYRCAVLTRSGYEAQAANLPEACQQLRAEKFNLVIVSPLGAESEGNFLASVPFETKTLVLPGLIFPRELLAAVLDRLPDGRRGMAAVRF